ncbi:hypothetical protein ACF09Z_21170 [Streptomyces erythrochromogenes]|uniref:hypothetical protein n=1 Tax=Streptomyces erythrochromogenes TaxID=285574 RepID=UPI0036F6836E
MRKMLLRRTAAGKALALSALLVLALPGTAYANTVGVTVKTPGATMGPGSAFSEISTDAACSSGLVSGGGINQAIGTGTSSNGNKINGTSPSPDGSTEYTGSTGVVGTDVTHWLGIGGSGGAVNASFSSTPYAMCFSSSLINHTQVVMNKLAGPTSSGTVGLVTATCPANTRLLGGGARITPASVGSLKPIASFPTFNDSAHGFGQKAAADGETNPDSWTAVGWNGGGGNSNNTTYAYAICSGNNINVAGATVKVRHSEVSGPTAATSGPDRHRRLRRQRREAGRRRRRDQRGQCHDHELHRPRIRGRPPQRQLPQRLRRHPRRRRHHQRRPLDGLHPHRRGQFAEHLLRRLGALRRRRRLTRRRAPFPFPCLFPIPFPFPEYPRLDPR